MARRFASRHACDGGSPVMDSHDEVYARLERIKALWDELRRARPRSRTYLDLVQKIHAESAAYLAVVEAVRAVAGKTDAAH
jgi:hypothetical protein